MTRTHVPKQVTRRVAVKVSDRGNSLVIRAMCLITQQYEDDQLAKVVALELYEPLPPRKLGPLFGSAADLQLEMPDGAKLERPFTSKSGFVWRWRTAV